jgi:hypothetical protein
MDRSPKGQNTINQRTGRVSPPGATVEQSRRTATRTCALKVPSHAFKECDCIADDPYAIEVRYDSGLIEMLDEEQVAMDAVGDFTLPSIQAKIMLTGVGADEDDDFPEEASQLANLIASTPEGTGDPQTEREIFSALYLGIQEEMLSCRPEREWKESLYVRRTLAYDKGEYFDEPSEPYFHVFCSPKTGELKVIEASHYDLFDYADGSVLSDNKSGTGGFNTEEAAEATVYAMQRLREEITETYYS